MADSEAGAAAAAAGMAHSFTQEYFQIPVVTRAYTTACVLTTAAVVRNKSFNSNLKSADQRGNLFCPQTVQIRDVAFCYSWTLTTF